MKRVGLWGVLATGALVFVSALFSYIWLPSVQLGGNVPFFSAWCSALGIGRTTTDNVARTTPTSDVVLDHELLPKEQNGDVGLGATLALRCSMCHGPTGITVAGAPNLAGQYPAVIYKQLRDFKNQVRSNAVMVAMASTLSDADMWHLAYFYGSVKRVAANDPDAPPPAIVKWGAPMRNIAPCGSCHGSLDHTMSSPWLAGEPAAYIRTQLQAFAAGTRSNDINGQMRSMAHALTPTEIDQIATYYGGAP